MTSLLGRERHADAIEILLASYDGGARLACRRKLDANAPHGFCLATRRTGIEKEPEREIHLYHYRIVV